MQYGITYEEKNPIDIILIYFILTSVVGFLLTANAVEEANEVQTEKAFIILYTLLIIQTLIYIITKKMQMRPDIIVTLDTIVVIFMFLFKMKRMKRKKQLRE